MPERLRDLVCLIFPVGPPSWEPDDRDVMAIGALCLAFCLAVVTIAGVIIVRILA